MKTQLYGTVLVAALSSSFSFAGSDDSAKGGVEIIAPPVQECSTREFQPLFTRFARISTDWSIKAGYRTVTGLSLQEARDIDATVMDLEITIPFTERLQARVYYPFSTDGDGYHFEDGGANVEIEGSEGLDDWPTIFLDYQFKQSTGAGDSNMTAYFGFGHVFRPLDVTIDNPGGTDDGQHFERYNHRGTGVELGVRMDKQLSNCLTFVGNAGLKYVWESDDLNPSGGADTFWTLDLGVGLFYTPKESWIYPGVEVLYETQLHPESYSSLMIVPEVIIPLGSNVDLSAGYGFGFMDGPDTDVRLSLTARF